MGILRGYEKIKDLRYIRRQKPEILTRREILGSEECVVIFDDVGKGFYKLKGSAGKIWNMLNGENTLEMIVAQLYQESPDDKEIIIKDVCKFIHTIGKKGLIKAALKKVPTAVE